MASHKNQITEKHTKSKSKPKLECGPMPNVMAALPNIAGALCKSSVIPFLVPRLKVWLTPAAGVPCSNAANVGELKTWTKVNFAPGKILSGARAPKNVYIA